MMKRILSLTLALCLLALPVLAEPAADAFTTASVYNFYGKIEGDELLNAINSHSGFYAVSTVNPDGTPNVAFFIYSCVKLDGTYYLMLGLNPNQTTANIDNGSEVVAMYGQLPADMEKAAYATSGARMSLKKVTDEVLLARLMESAPQGYQPMFYEITAVNPLG